jgi:TonB-dependent starch-binding outer membrane protein SusC
MIARVAVAVFFLLSLAPGVLAQERTIRGTVVDAAAGDPVVGAEVRVAGTALRTSATEDGSFVLERVPAGPATIVVSRLGFRRAEIQVPADRTTVEVALETDIFGLEEVVVTGQATGAARRHLPNAVATMRDEDFGRSPSETMERMLAGRIPGANIQANSNAPGGGIQVELRGITSFLGGGPLYVVDGVIVSDVTVPSGTDAITRATTGSNPSESQDNPANRIADLNPADIESVEILKGASASAIYGSKASNGVIIITTKRGQAGATRVDVAQRFGTFDLARTITRPFRTPAEVDEAFGPGTADAFDFDPNRNWERELAGRNALSHETNVRVSGGSEDTRYFISGTWKEDEGIIRNTGFDRQALRVNVDQDFGERLTAQVSTNLLRTLARRGVQGNDNAQVSPWFAGTTTPRFVDLARQPDGTFPDNPFAPSNPLQTLALLQNDEEVWRFIGSARLNLDAYRTPRHAVTLLADFGVDRFSQENSLVSPPEMQFEPLDGLPGTSVLTNASGENLNLAGHVVYSFTPGPRFDLRTSAGVQYDTRDLNIATVTARNLLGGQSNIDRAAVIDTRQRRERVEDLGFFLQEELLIDDRLFLTAGIRADQSSANVRDDRLFFYPKAAASYRFESPVAQIDELKFRFAYGESGKQPLFGQKFTPLEGGERIEGILGFQIEGTVAGNLKPERQREFEGGLDAIFANGRAQIEATVFRRQIQDLLNTRSLPPSTGFAREVFNGGRMRVNGVEAALTVAPLRGREVTWVSTTTFGANRSKVQELPVPPFIPEPGRAGFVFGPSLGAFCIEEGASATQIIGNVPGERDACGGLFGKVGDSNPDFRMGFSNQATWRNWNLFFLFDWQNGSEVINLTKLLFDLGNNYFDCTNDPDTNPCAQRLGTFGSDIGSTYVEDASFVKLREITLAWELPDQVRERIWGDLRHARLNISGRNLLTFTDYTGMDPEVSNFGSQAVGRNVDVAAFPRTRSFWFGIDLGF